MTLIHADCPDAAGAALGPELVTGLGPRRWGVSAGKSPHIRAAGGSRGWPPGTVPRDRLRAQRALQLRLRHLGATRDVAALRLLVELGPRAFGAVAPGGVGAFAPLGAAQVALVLLAALVFRGARLAERDRDRLLRVLHLAAAATALQLAMLELVHDA